MNPLAADHLMSDKRIDEAKKLILEAIDEAQNHIIGVKPSDPERKVYYEELLEAFKDVRGGALYYPYIGSGLGKGALVELVDGSVKYDFICGIGPHYFGHSHKGLIEAGIDGALSNTIMQGHLQQNVEPLRLMEKLVEISGLDHCFLSTSGAMATENALKLAFHYKEGANRVIAFDKCFMGRTLALSYITDKPQFRVGLPQTLSVDYIPFLDHEDEEGSTDRANHELRKILARYPGKHAAFCFELIQGEGGFRVGSHKFFSQLMNTLKEHDVPVIIDEVQSFGRTSDLFAFKHFGLENFVDIVAVGKLSQACATLFTDKMCPKPGLLSQTFTASSASIHAALYILDDLINGGYYGNEGKIAKMHQECLKRFEALEKKHPGVIRGPYGEGSMVAFTPYDGEPQQVLHVAKELFEAGLITFVAGANPMRIRMLLPVPVLTTKDLDEAFALIDKTLEKSKEVLL